MTESEFIDAENIAWHLSNGTFEIDGETADESPSNGSSSEWSSFTVDQLKAKATELGLTFDSKATKAALIGLIEANIAEDSKSSEPGA